MADIADRASQDEELYLELAIKAARGIPADKRANLISADNCEECGNEIPSAKQIAVPGCQLCIECARFIEIGL